MIYPALLSLHSLFRWLVVAALLFALARAGRGRLFNQPFSRTDEITRCWAATLAQVQLLLGLWLYSVSPLVAHFFSQKAVHQRELRFFSVEHGPAMLLAVLLLSIGSYKAGRHMDPGQKFKTIIIWYSSALLLMLIAVPWSFSPMVQRPLWRGW